MAITALILGGAHNGLLVETAELRPELQLYAPEYIDTLKVAKVSESDKPFIDPGAISVFDYHYLTKVSSKTGNKILFVFVHEKLKVQDSTLVRLTVEVVLDQLEKKQELQDELERTIRVARGRLGESC